MALKELTQDSTGVPSYKLVLATLDLIPKTAEIQQLEKGEKAIYERFEEPWLEMLHRWRESKVDSARTR